MRRILEVKWFCGFVKHQGKLKEDYRGKMCWRIASKDSRRKTQDSRPKMEDWVPALAVQAALCGDRVAGLGVYLERNAGLGVYLERNAVLTCRLCACEHMHKVYYRCHMLL